MKKFSIPDFKKKDKEKDKNGKSSFFKKPPYINLIYSSIIINVLSIAGIFLLKNLLPPEIPLFYGLAEGVEQLTNSTGLITAPLVSLSIVILNTITASLLNNDLLRKTLVVTGFSVTIFMLVTLIQIVLLVGYF